MALNQELAEKPGSVADDLTTQFVGEISNIFATMVGVPDVNYLSQEDEAVTQLTDSVTAMVGLAGTCNGIVSIHTPQTLALKFAAQMLGMDVSEVADDINDALGEIANMIGGSFKHHLSNGGNDIKLSTPSVVAGTNYSFTTANHGKSLTLNFSADGEEFKVSVVLEPE
jgi:chemotaxis protein CheX